MILKAIPGNYLRREKGSGHYRW